MTEHRFRFQENSRKGGERANQKHDDGIGYSEVAKVRHDRVANAQHVD
jgi:hypothetical protein